HAQRPLYYTAYTAPLAPPAEPLPVAATEAPAAANLDRAPDARTTQLASALAGASLTRSRERFQHFLDRVSASPDLLARLETDGKLAARVLDIFEHSSYFADTLVRYPELVDEI